MLKEKVIKKFVFTQKSEQQKRDSNVYTFHVDPSANKFQIRYFLEKFFNVKVEKVCVSLRKPVLRNSRKNIYTKLKKKMFVKLVPGYKINENSGNNISLPE